MTTRLDLRNLCRRRLGDLALPYRWSDLQLNQWLNDAIADYGLYFPRALSLEIDAEAGVRAYDLPSDFQAALRVEYPAGEEPPNLLQRLPLNDQDFWELAERYDIVSRNDGTTASELWLSDTPHVGETIRIEYLADHASLDDDGDTAQRAKEHGQGQGQPDGGRFPEEPGVELHGLFGAGSPPSAGPLTGGPPTRPANMSRVRSVGKVSVSPARSAAARAASMRPRPAA